METPALLLNIIQLSLLQILLQPSLEVIQSNIRIWKSLLTNVYLYFIFALSYKLI